MIVEDAEPLRRDMSAENRANIRLEFENQSDQTDRQLIRREVTSMARLNPGLDNQQFNEVVSAMDIPVKEEHLDRLVQIIISDRQKKNRNERQFSSLFAGLRIDAIRRRITSLYPGLSPVARLENILPPRDLVIINDNDRQQVVVGSGAAVQSAVQNLNMLNLTIAPGIEVPVPESIRQNQVVLGIIMNVMSYMKQVLDSQNLTLNSEQWRVIFTLVVQEVLMRLLRHQYNEGMRDQVGQGMIQLQNNQLEIYRQLVQIADREEANVLIEEILPDPHEDVEMGEDVARERAEMKDTINDAMNKALVNVSNQVGTPMYQMVGQIGLISKIVEDWNTLMSEQRKEITEFINTFPRADILQLFKGVGEIGTMLISVGQRTEMVQRDIVESRDLILREINNTLEVVQRIPTGPPEQMINNITFIAQVAKSLVETVTNLQGNLATFDRDSLARYNDLVQRLSNLPASLLAIIPKGGSTQGGGQMVATIPPQLQQDLAGIVTNLNTLNGNMQKLLTYTPPATNLTSEDRALISGMEAKLNDGVNKIISYKPPTPTLPPIPPFQLSAEDRALIIASKPPPMDHSGITAELVDIKNRINDLSGKISSLAIPTPVLGPGPTSMSLDFPSVPSAPPQLPFPTLPNVPTTSPVITLQDLNNMKDEIKSFFMTQIAETNAKIEALSKTLMTPLTPSPLAPIVPEEFQMASVDMFQMPNLENGGVQYSTLSKPSVFIDENGQTMIVHEDIPPMNPINPAGPLAPLAQELPLPTDLPAVGPINEVAKTILHQICCRYKYTEIFKWVTKNKKNQRSKEAYLAYKKSIGGKRVRKSELLAILYKYNREFIIKLTSRRSFTGSCRPNRRCLRNIRPAIEVDDPEFQQFQ